MKFDRATLKSRFSEAQAEKAAAEAAIQPLVDMRDAIIAQMRPLNEQLDALNEQLKAARQPIYELSCEIGSIAKFFRGADGKSKI